MSVLQAMEYLEPITAPVNAAMDNLAATAGWTKSFTYFTVAFLLSVPTHWIQGMMPSRFTRHAFAALSGLWLYYFAFGRDIIHILAPMAITYLAMLVHRGSSGIVAWCTVFPYLIWSHVAQASGENWTNGEIDYTGAEMVVMLKLISCAVAYQDGGKKASDLTDHQKEVKLDKCPTLLEFSGYFLYCGNLFVGPYFEMKDYLDFSRKTGPWKKPLPGKSLTVARLVVVAFVCCGFNLWALQWWSPSVLKGPWLETLPYWHRMAALVAVSTVARFKYYFAFKLVEAALVLSGLSYNGTSKGGKASWDRLANVDILGVELCHTAAALPAAWNICTGRWLRYYVYERVTQKGKKPGLPQLVITQIVSGVWHGLFPGYILFFLSTAFFVHGSKVVYRYEKGLTGFGKHIARALHTVFTMVCLGYLAVTFLVLDFASCKKAWLSVYFAPHVVLLLELLAGFVMPPPRPAKKKAT